MSPTVTPAAALCCALRCVGDDMSSATAATVSNRLVRRFIVRSSNAWSADRRVGKAKRAHRFVFSFHRWARRFAPCPPYTHSLRQRIGPQLELDHLAGRALAAFDVIRRATRIGRPQASAFQPTVGSIL